MGVALGMAESEKAAKYLQDAGYDMLNADNGTYDSWYWAHPPMYMPENCNLEDVAHIKKFVDIPVVCAGRMDAEVGAKAVEEGKIVGSILCGHDGRHGCLYHVCVDEAYRMHGIGKNMVVACMEALMAEHINKVTIIAFTKNDIGNAFWRKIGWTQRMDLNYYDFTLNEDNITRFNQ